MIKCCEKKILFVEGSENSPFETAYFVLKKESHVGGGGDDIVRAADIIINERLPEENRKQKKKAKAKRVFALMLSGVMGFLIGGGSVVLLYLFI